jgi:tripartite-type tricarboxylate transporter receptor subunit TctC
MGFGIPLDTFGVAREKHTMKLPRRTFLSFAVSVAVLPALSRITLALDYPTRPVRLVVGFFAGGLSDIMARLIAQPLSERLGQQVIVDDRPGAGSNIATELVTKASPDGYTLLLVPASATINASLYDNLNFNFSRDIVPVASISRTPGVMVVNLSLPVRTVPEFIAYAKANPGTINFASAGTGSLPHVAGELFKLMTGLNLVRVSYRSNYFPDLIAGQVQVSFATVPSAIEFVRAGKLRALAVTGAARSEALPGVPTVSEFIPGYEADAWNGVGAPANTPAEIIKKLNKEINAALAEPAMQVRLAELGSEPLSMMPSEFGKFIAAEIEK